MAEAEVRLDVHNSREIDIITQVIEDEDLKAFLCSFLKQENDYDEIVRKEDELELTDGYVLATMKEFVKNGCTVCTEFFLLQFKTLFEAETLTALAELSVKHKQLEILKVLHNHGAVLLEDFLTNAIVNLDAPIVKYLIFLDVGLDDNDAERLVDFLATRVEGYEIYLILEELIRSQGKTEILKDVLRLANEADNEQLISYLMRKNLVQMKEKTVSGLLPIEGVNAMDNNVEARWYEKNWRRWTQLNTRVLKSLTDYNILTVDLSNNRLANIIPAFFDGSLPFLSMLTLNDNNFESLPDLTYPCINQLVKVDLKRNRLNELPFIYLCMPRIEQLLVSKNKIIRITFWEEEDPSRYMSAASESNLKILNLGENLLETIPEEFGQFRRMIELNCRCNRIESFPINWHLSSRLEEIDLGSNMLNSFAFQHPPGLWKMTLRTLLLSRNKFTWIPQFVTKLRMLLNLDFNNNDLHDFPADSLWECQLSELKISNNKRIFTRELYEISSSMNLEVTRPNLACFEKTLFSLDISENDLAEVPIFVHSLKNLRFLYLDHNPNLNELPPELSLLQKLKAIGIEETPLANLPKQYQPTPGQVYLNVDKIMKYLEERRLNSERMHTIQLVILGCPSVVLQRLELDIMGLSRKKLVLDCHRMENIKGLDTQMYSSGRRTGSLFSMKGHKPPLKIRVWIIDNIDAFNSIKYMVESERTLYILATDIARRYVGCIEAKEWLQAIYDRELRIASNRVTALLDFSQQIEKDVQRDIIANFRMWESMYNFHAVLIFKEAETIRKEVYNWGDTVCNKLSKVPEYMMKVFNYFEIKENDGDTEFVFQKNEFYGICETNSKEHCWSDKDRSAFRDLLQSCGYLFHCKDTWSNLDNFYFTKPKVFFDFILRFVKTSAITIESECGKARLSELEEIIHCYSQNERVKTAIIAILEQYELAFKITENIVLAVQFLHEDKPAIIAKSEMMDFENSFYFQAKGTDRVIMEMPQYNRLYCFEQNPCHFFSLLMVYLTSHSKQASDYQFKPSEWNLVMWKNGIEAFIGEQHILITQANIDQLSNNILSCHIVRGRKITDEQTIELRRADLRFFISVAIYSKSAYESLKKLGNICDAIENLARQEQFNELSDGCCRMIPCNGCIENANLHLLSIDDLLTIEKGSYYCDASRYRYNVEKLLPEYFLKDQPKNILITNTELNFNKNTSKKIGEGTEGTVYKHEYKGHEVAVKVRSRCNFPNVKKSKEYLDMRKEAVFLQKLQHSYLMGIIAVTTSPLCLVLEYASYSSLNKVLDYHLQEYGLGAMKNGILGTILTHQIAIEMASALEYLHRNNIIYFDLKSANVLVMSLDMYSQLHVKLTDYGISEMIVPKGFKGYRGTPGFMAPELYPEEGINLAVDEKVDVYSYAYFLCELLFGRNPAAGDRNLLEKVRNGVRPVCSSKEIPFHMFSLIQRCWEQLPQMRPSTSEILQELAEVRFVMKNKAASINTRGFISGAFQIRGATLPTEKGVDLTKSMMDALFPPPRHMITLSNSSGAAAKDLSGSYHSVSDIRTCTPNLRSKFPHINQTVKYDMSTDGFCNRTEHIDFNSHSVLGASVDANDSAVIISSSTEQETDIILMKMTTGEYYNDLRIEYPHVTSIVIYNSFMWLAATRQKGEPGVIMMYSLPLMNLMFQEEEDTVRKLIAFPLEETETSMDVNIIAVLAREIVVYHFQLRGDFLHPKDRKYDIINFCKSTVYTTDSIIGAACVVKKNELWFCFGKNNLAQLVVLDISFKIPKVTDELPPIHNVIAIGDMIYAGKCIWLNDKGELNLWKIDYHTKKVYEFAELVYNKEHKTINRNGSIVKKCPKQDLSPTHKLRKQTDNPCNFVFKIKSFSAVEECRASREISHLENVNVKLQQTVDYMSQSATLRPGLQHIDIENMFYQAATVDEFASPVASLHAGNETVWAFLGDGKICIFDSNTAYDELSVLCIIKTQAEYYSAKYLKIPAAITTTESHVIIIRKSSNKEVIDMDGFDYYVEVWQNLTADEIRCYNRVVLAAQSCVGNPCNVVAN